MALTRFKRQQLKSRLERTARINELGRMGVFKQNDQRGFASKAQLKELLETDKYKDIVITKKERQNLEAEDWTVVVSSTVKAIKNVNNHLYIMFHNGYQYLWTFRGNIHYPRMLRSVSKGRYVWNFLYNSHNMRIR